MNAKEQLFDKLSYMARRPNLNEVLQLINQLDDNDINAKDHRGFNLLHLAVGRFFK